MRSCPHRWPQERNDFSTAQLKCHLAQYRQFPIRGRRGPALIMYTRRGAGNDQVLCFQHRIAMLC